MTNIEIVRTLINAMDTSSVQDEAIKQAVLALLDHEPKKAETKKTGRKKKSIDMGKAKACRQAGWSFAKIADELGVSEMTIRKHLNEAGVE